LLILSLADTKMTLKINMASGAVQGFWMLTWYFLQKQIVATIADKGWCSRKLQPWW